MLDDAAHGGKPVSHLSLVIGGEERTFSVRITQETQGRSALRQRGYSTTSQSWSRHSAPPPGRMLRRRIRARDQEPAHAHPAVAAERLRRKYGRVIQEDREVFDRCTDTIIRRWGTVTRMVDSSRPSRAAEAADGDHTSANVVRAAVLDRHVTTAEITFGPKSARCQSCCCATAAHCAGAHAPTSSRVRRRRCRPTPKAARRSPAGRGRIETIVTAHPDNVTIEVIDNGPGLPKHNRNRLLEPYVTTRATKARARPCDRHEERRQHAGTLALEDAPPAPDRTHGALVASHFPSVAMRQRAPCRSQPPRAADDTDDSATLGAADGI